MSENLQNGKLLGSSHCKGGLIHPSIQAYLSALDLKRRSALTHKAVQQDLSRFAKWWEGQRQRNFDPALLLESAV